MVELRIEIPLAGKTVLSLKLMLEIAPIETLELLFVTPIKIQAPINTSADSFDYIECFFNLRRRRKLETLKLKEANLTQLSVETG